MLAGRRRSSRIREKGVTPLPPKPISRKKVKIEHPEAFKFQNPNAFASSQPQLGIQGLPLEILYEIVEQLPPPLQFPIAPRCNAIPLLETPLLHSEAKLEKTKALRALSQTCKRFRDFALPLAWEKIEIVGVRSVALEKDTPGARKTRRKIWEKELATELVAQLEVVTVRNPQLLKHVRSFTAFITPYSSKNVARELARCFGLMPSLHTVQLLAIDDEHTWPSFEHFTSAFETKYFPSIRSLALPSYARSLFKCCPNLETAIGTLDPQRPIDRISGRRMLSDIILHCPRIKKIEGLPIDWERDMDDILSRCENLTSLGINDFCPQDGLPSLETLSRLAYLPSLSHLSLTMYRQAEDSELYSEDQSIAVQCIILLIGANIYGDKPPEPPRKELCSKRIEKVLASFGKPPQLDDPVSSFFISYNTPPWIWRDSSRLTREGQVCLEQFLERKPLPTVTVNFHGNPELGIFTGRRLSDKADRDSAKDFYVQLWRRTADPFEDLTAFTPRVRYKEYHKVNAELEKKRMEGQAIEINTLSTQ